MGETRSGAVDLAERLADRLCHDISSSAQALASGVDLLREAATSAERDEALALLSDAMAAQKFKVGYARRAYGVAQAADTGELKALAEALYADLRPTLEWAMEAPNLGPDAARSVLILLQIAADALAAGGRARLTATLGTEGTVVEVEAAGPRVALKDDVRDGLEGRQFATGLGGRWVQGAFVAALAASAGGAVELRLGEGVAAIRISLPAV